MTTDELQRLLTIPPPREIRQTGSLVYNVDEREDKRWKAARVRLAEAVPALLFRIDQLETELTGAKIFWTDAHERAEQADVALAVAAARNQSLQHTLEQIANRDETEMAHARTLHYDMRGWARAALAQETPSDA